jgi:hypothetical protein
MHFSLQITKGILRIVQGIAAVVLILSAQLLPVVFAAQLEHRTPKDSYLVHQVKSVKELVAEIHNHPFIRNRYSRLYHIPGGAVEQYIAKNLILTRLSKPYRHVVYCITPDGVVFTAVETQPTGSEVFATRDGKPVLRWACGNPFSSILPRVPRGAVASTVVFTGDSERHPKAGISPHIARKATPGAARPPKGAPVIEKVSAYVASLPPLKTVTNEIVPRGGGGGTSLSPWLSFLPLFWLNGLHSPGSSGPDTTGGGTTGGIAPTVPITPHSTTTTTSGTTGSPGPALTPEPGSGTIWSLAGLFLAGVAGLGRRRKSSQAPKTS